MNTQKANKLRMLEAAQNYLDQAHDYLLAAGEKTLAKDLSEVTCSKVDDLIMEIATDLEEATV